MPATSDVQQQYTARVLLHEASRVWEGKSPIRKSSELNWSGLVSQGRVLSKLSITQKTTQASLVKIGFLRSSVQGVVSANAQLYSQTM